MNLPNPIDNRLAGWIGRRVLRLFLYLLDLVIFSAWAVRSSWHGSRLLNPTVRASLVAQLLFSGVDALPVIGLIAVGVGVSLTYQIIALMRIVAESGEVMGLLVQLVVLEFGPLLTAMVVAGRASSTITMELGNMQLRREVEGLELLGIDIYDLLVTPRLVGAALSHLMLATYFSVIALVSGILVGALLISPGVLGYLGDLPYAFHPADILLFTFKNLLYGMIIGTTTCFHAFRVQRSPTEVPHQAQRALVVSLAMIFLLDGAIALL